MPDSRKWRQSSSTGMMPSISTTACPICSVSGVGNRHHAGYNRYQTGEMWTAKCDSSRSRSEVQSGSPVRFMLQNMLTNRPKSKFGDENVR